MRNVPRPSVTVAQTLTQAVARFDIAVQQGWLAIEPNLSAAEADYDPRAMAAALFQTPQTTSVGPITQQQLSDLYSEELAKAKGAARQVYSYLRELAPFGICPMCGVGKVATLDHYLPKKKYSALAVTPVNLVPCCRDCNAAKTQKHPNAFGDQTFHPYYDDVQSDQWLFADVHTGRVSVTFRVAAPPNWTTEEFERACTHFHVFKLEALFAANAAQAMAELSHQLARLSAAGGADLVRAHLIELRDSAAALYLNSWQTALFQALSESEWFCDTGCLLIPSS